MNILKTIFRTAFITISVIVIVIVFFVGVFWILETLSPEPECFESGLICDYPIDSITY